MVTTLKVNIFGIRVDGEGKEKSDVNNESDGKIPWS